MPKIHHFIIVLISIFFNCNYSISAQIQKSDFQYASSPKHPYGAYNPDAPEELKDFEPMIGSNLCENVQRKPDGSWQDTVSVIWEFKYIFNGKAVQDVTWKEDVNHSMSIRQFNPDSSKWAVTYFSSANANFTPSTWAGGKTENGDIVLTMSQKAPGSGRPGTNRLTFFDISDDRFNWVGEWVSEDETIVYPFWKIWCVKEDY